MSPTLTIGSIKSLRSSKDKFALKQSADNASPTLKRERARNTPRGTLKALDFNLATDYPSWKVVEENKSSTAIMLKSKIYYKFVKSLCQPRVRSLRAT